MGILFDKIKIQQEINEKISISKYHLQKYLDIIKRDIKAKSFDFDNVSKGDQMVMKVSYDTGMTFLIEIDGDYGAIIGYNTDGGDKYNFTPKNITSYKDIKKNIKILSFFDVKKSVNADTIIKSKPEFRIGVGVDDELDKWGITQLKDGLTLSDIETLEWLNGEKKLGKSLIIGQSKGLIDVYSGAWSASVLEEAHVHENVKIISKCVLTDCYVYCNVDNVIMNECEFYGTMKGGIFNGREFYGTMDGGTFKAGDWVNGIWKSGKWESENVPPEGVNGTTQPNTQNVTVEEFNYGGDSDMLGGSFTSGKQTVEVVIYSDKRINIIVKNASHSVWRGGGKMYDTFEQALSSYKHADVIACIKKAEEMYGGVNESQDKIVDAYNKFKAGDWSAMLALSKPDQIKVSKLVHKDNDKFNNDRGQSFPNFN